MEFFRVFPGNLNNFFVIVALDYKTALGIEIYSFNVSAIVNNSFHFPEGVFERT